MPALLELADRFAARPGRLGLRAWARPGYFTGPLVRTPVRRVLALCCAWVGDTLWDVQVVPALEAALPEAEVHVATRRRAAGLVAGLPAPRRHVLDHVPSDRRREPVDLRALAAEAALLRRLEYDLIVDLTGNRYSALFSFLARPRAALGFDAAPAGWLYTRRVSPSVAEHRALRPWRVVAPLVGAVDDPQGAARREAGLAPAEAEPGPWLPAAAPPPPRLPPGCEAPWERAAEATGLARDEAFVVLAPGAGWAGKRWPAERFAALATRLRARGLTVVVTGAGGEADLVRRVAAPAGARAVESPDLGVAIALCARARLVVSNDSGIGHLAAAAGAPVVSLFSATNPAMCRPLGARVTLLRAGCDARPTGGQHHCHDVAGHPCPAACWDALTVDVVDEACARALGV